MKKFRFEDMFRGWFVGDFEPTAFNLVPGQRVFGSPRAR